MFHRRLTASPDGEESKGTVDFRIGISSADPDYPVVWPLIEVEVNRSNDRVASPWNILAKQLGKLVFWRLFRQSIWYGFIQSDRSQRFFDTLGSAWKGGGGSTGDGRTDLLSCFLCWPDLYPHKEVTHHLLFFPQRFEHRWDDQTENIVWR